MKQTFHLLAKNLLKFLFKLVHHLVHDRDEILQNRLHQLLSEIKVFDMEARENMKNLKFLTEVGRYKKLLQIFAKCLVCLSQGFLRKISSYPTKTIQEGDMNDAIICSICRSNYQLGNIVLTMSECSHQFHVNCIKRWITEGKRTCPNCRAFIGMCLFGFFRIQSSRFQLLSAEFQKHDCSYKSRSQPKKS